MINGYCRHLLAGVMLIVVAACSGVPNPIQSSTPATSTPYVPQVGDWMPAPDSAELVYVPAGSFEMGSGGFDDPKHNVNLAAYWIYRSKVTNRMYSTCVNLGVCKPPQDQQALQDLGDFELLDVPVVGATWEEASTYCAWANARLPTEAEWEKAARGPEANPYPWGVSEPNCELLNFNNCIGKTSSVIDYPAGKSYYEALDMAGNAFEWVADWYASDYYSNSPSSNPRGPATGEARVIRGSSYQSSQQDAPSTRRFSLDPENFRPDLSFRCVVNQPEFSTPYCETSMLAPQNGLIGPVITVTAGYPEDLTISTSQSCQFGLGVVTVTSSHRRILFVSIERVRNYFQQPPSCIRLNDNQWECRSFDYANPLQREALICFAEASPGAGLCPPGFVPARPGDSDVFVVNGCIWAREQGNCRRGFAQLDNYCIWVGGGNPDIAECPAYTTAITAPVYGCLDTVQRPFDVTPVTGITPSTSDASGGSCLGGYEYDSQRACCQAPMGGSYPGCGPNEFRDPLAPVWECLPNPNCILTTLQIQDCPSPSNEQGGEDGGSNEENSCAPPCQMECLTSCSCVCP